MNRFDQATLAYVGAFLTRADLRLLRRWLTTKCPDCNQEPPAADLDHVTLRGSIAVSCKNRWLINPNALGMDMPDWEDWRKVQPYASIGIWYPAGEPDSPAVRAKAVITVELLAHAGEPLGKVKESLLRAIHRVDFEVQSDPFGDANGFQTIEIIAQP